MSRRRQMLLPKNKFEFVLLLLPLAISMLVVPELLFSITFLLGQLLFISFTLIFVVIFSA